MTTQKPEETTIFVFRQRSTDEVSYYSFVQTDRKFETSTRLSRILHGFYSFEDDDKSVFTNLYGYSLF